MMRTVQTSSITTTSMVGSNLGVYCPQRRHDASMKGDWHSIEYTVGSLSQAKLGPALRKMVGIEIQNLVKFAVFRRLACLVILSVLQ